MNINYISSRSELPPDGWHLQIAENTEVVGWWYDQAPPNYWDEPDVVKRMGRLHRRVLDWTFELPEPLEVDGKIETPVEIERANLCVWQWVHNQGGGLGIYVAHSPEQAIELAIASSDRATRKTSRHKFRSDHVVKAIYYRTFDEYFEKVIEPGLPAT